MTPASLSLEARRSGRDGFGSDEGVHDNSISPRKGCAHCWASGGLALVRTVLLSRASQEPGLVGGRRDKGFQQPARQRSLAGTLHVRQSVCHRASPPSLRMSSQSPPPISSCYPILSTSQMRKTKLGRESGQPQVTEDNSRVDIAVSLDPHPSLRDRGSEEVPAQAIQLGGAKGTSE